jgi:transposase
MGFARDNKRARLLMSAPSVGIIVALTYVSAIDDPGRFRLSKAVGPHFGLTPNGRSPAGAAATASAATIPLFMAV